MTTIQSIPSLDLNDFKSTNEQTKENFVRELGEAYKNIGFISLKNYGLSPEIENELYSEVKNFFEMPLEKNYNTKKPNLMAKEDTFHLEGKQQKDIKNLI